MKLMHKVAVITGGAQGIGNAVAELFALEGACVAILDNNEQFGKKAAQRIIDAGGTAGFFFCDVSIEYLAQQALSEVMEQFGTIDILVNVAAWQFNKPLLQTTTDEFKEVMDINMTGTFIMTRDVAKIMIKQEKGGAIINFSSSFALVGSDGYAAYHASKGAVSSFTRAAAVSLMEHNIRVNAIVPGTTLTPGLRAGARCTGNEEEALAAFKAKQPLGRFGTPQEIAQIALMLASDEASFVYGANWVVDGGYTIV